MKTSTDCNQAMQGRSSQVCASNVTKRKIVGFGIRREQQIGREKC